MIYPPTRQSLKMLLTSSMLMIFMLSDGFTQSISGFVKDENNNPVAFANVFVRELNTGTAADGKGYYFLNIDPGLYNLVYSSIGYQTKSIQVIVSDQPLTRHMVLPASDIALDEVVVKANRKDPAYEIIQQVIGAKEKYLTQIKSARTKVYVRAIEVIGIKKKAPSAQEESQEIAKEGPPPGQFAAEKKKEEERLQHINMVEMQLTLNFQYPSQYKEERTGFKAYGSKEGLFIPIFSESDFNFYHNLVNLKGIAEVPVISPVSKFAVLSYKYKLEEILQEEKIVVYKIKVIPRKTGDATCKGYLYINDSTWNINRLELTLEKGGLKFYDAFTIKQTYQNIAEDIWIPSRQEFIYQTKAGAKSFLGNTVWLFTDYEKDYQFPPRFFGNEVAVTTKEAYERDSSFWNSNRAEPLTPEEQKVITYRDSIEAVHKTKNYLDSMEARFNKITLGEVLYHGVGFRKEAKKSNIYISPLLSLINFEVIGGFRLGPFLSYFRRFENGRRLYTAGSFTLGLKNRDWQGHASVWTRYNPYRLGDLSVRAGRSFYSINSFDAYLNQLRISNYILHEHVDVFHRIELLNGLYISAELGFHNRHSVENYNRTSIINQVIEEDDPLVFENYQALISHVRIAYTPKQRFMREPNQKVVLGSKYPTFSLSYKKGWNNKLLAKILRLLFSGSIRHCKYLQLGKNASQTFSFCFCKGQIGF